MSTPVMSSFTVTVPFPLQSPMHPVTAIDVGVGVADGVGVGNTQAISQQISLPFRHSHLPQQQPQVVSEGQLGANGLHSLMVGIGVGVMVGVGTCVGSEQGSAQHGRYGGMQTHVPQQQLHCFPTGQSCADGLHASTVGSGVGVVTPCVAEADNERVSAVTNTHVVRSVGIGELRCYCDGSTDCQC